MYPVSANHASKAGHPCERYLVLYRTRGQERRMHDVGLEFIFQRGRAAERVALDELRAAGFEVIEQQRKFQDPRLQLTGAIDGKLRPPGHRDFYPTEVKALSHFDWPKLNCMQDFLDSDKPWLQTYPAQIQLYMYLDAKPLGMWYIKDGTTWLPKSIWVELDYDYCEGILQKLERVNAHVAAGTLPDGINDVDACPGCDFYHLCLPPLTDNALVLDDDPELVAMVARFMELKPAKAECEKLDAKLKPLLAGREKAIIGDYLVTGKLIQHSGKPATPPGEYWRKSIKPLGDLGVSE